MQLRSPPSSLRTVFLALALMTAALAQAEIYQWTTPDGTVHFGDQVPVQHRDSARAVETTPPSPTRQDANTTREQSQRIQDAAEALAQTNRLKEQERAARRRSAPQPPRTVPYELPESPERSLNYHSYE